MFKEKIDYVITNVGIKNVVKYFSSYTKNKYDAKIVERHVTLSHDLWGTDQASSLEVHAMDLLNKDMVK